MSHELLLCPQCKCPLPAPAKSAIGMACPRCNQWVALDSTCTGVCLSCHKTSAKSSMTSCTEPESVPVSIDEAGSLSSRGGEQVDGRDDNLAGGRWKRLFMGLFTVR